MSNQSLRIGTRDSKLATWQARQVQNALQQKGIAAELVFVKSPGDKDLQTPLHQFGTTGIFTNMLDEALLNNKIDVAVHSLKDYPTTIPEGITMAGVLERGPYQDVLVHKGPVDFLEDENIPAIIATGSIRRVAQWKHRYPHHETTNLRGNVQTRLQKLHNHNWQGAIFAKAGLQRVHLLPKNHVELNWMLPAPAQGVVSFACRSADNELTEKLKTINHQQTHIRSQAERQFLNTVEGGCSAPVGALSEIKGTKIYLRAAIFELDGSQKVSIENEADIEDPLKLGREAAQKVLARGGKEIMEKLKDA